MCNCPHSGSENMKQAVMHHTVRNDRCSSWEAQIAEFDWVWPAAAQLPPCVLVAFSNGAVIAAELARRHPEVVHGILFASGVPVDEQVIVTPPGGVVFTAGDQDRLSHGP